MAQRVDAEGKYRGMYDQKPVIERYRDWQYRWGLYTSGTLTGLGLTFYLFVWAIGLSLALPVVIGPFSWFVRAWWWFWAGGTVC